MTDYRIYSLNEYGLIGFAEHYAATCDKEAVSMVSELTPNAIQWEVWEGRRLVAESRVHETAA